MSLLAGDAESGSSEGRLFSYNWASGYIAPFVPADLDAATSAIEQVRFRLAAVFLRFLGAYRFLLLPHPRDHIIGRPHLPPILSQISDSTVPGFVSVFPTYPSPTRRPHMPCTAATAPACCTPPTLGAGTVACCWRPLGRTACRAGAGAGRGAGPCGKAGRPEGGCQWQVVRNHWGLAPLADDYAVQKIEHRSSMCGRRRCEKSAANKHPPTMPEV